MRVSRPRKRKRSSNSEQPEGGFPKLSADSLLNMGCSSESTNPSQTAAFVEDDVSGINIVFHLFTCSEFVAAAGPSAVSESRTATPAQPPRKQLKLSPLKGLGVQRDGIAISAADYAKNYCDEFKEEYLEYAKAVLPADLHE